MDPQTQVRVRFAPSPTGRFHIGGARTALYNYLLARQTGGQFILRIEDTDQKRYVPDAEEEMKTALRWLGVEWDEGPDVGGPHAPYRQSERRDIYAKYGRELVERGHAYYCFCTPERLSKVRKQQQQMKLATRYDGLCRRLDPAEAQARVDAGEAHVIRFKMPTDGETSCVDVLRGEIKVENANLDDYILVKSNGLPVYHLAALIDDHLMGITHVFRGSEWLPTFPLHVRIYQAFGWDQPQWVHLSIFLNPSGKGKLSKRQATTGAGGAMAIFTTDLAELGYIPEAAVNWLALMGWSYDDHTEYFTMADLIEKFSLRKLNPSPAAVNFSKLDHFNGVHIRALAPDDLSARLLPYFRSAGYDIQAEELTPVVPLIQERIQTLDEAPVIAGFFFHTEIEPDPGLLVGKNMTPAESARAAEHALACMEELGVEHIEPLEAALRKVAEDLGLKAGQLFGILRIAITGQRVSPPLLESMQIIGKKLTVQRMKTAIQCLKEQAGA